MNSATQHIDPVQLAAFTDRELSGPEAQEIQSHVAACHACALRVLAEMETKRAVTRVAGSVAPSSASLARLTAQLQGGKKKTRVFTMPVVGWVALAACLLIVASLAFWSSRRAQNTLSAELLDQHLAVLSDASTPEVLSTDRHTVKPWFQGKLPFSFNIPEAAELPPDTVLRGADLAYVEGQPAALLLFNVHKHQVSVFLTQQESMGHLVPGSNLSGFNLRSVNAGHLRLIGVSDVNPRELDALVMALAQVQAKN